MKPQTFLVSMGLISLFAYSPFIPTPKAIAETSNIQSQVSCQQLEESFGIDIENYVFDHHGGSIIDISLEYRLITGKEVKPSDYPDFVPIVAKIKTFLEKYPNTTDYWEIVNKNLAWELLASYPQISAIDLTLKVHPNATWPLNRFSRIREVRPGNCSL